MTENERLLNLWNHYEEDNGHRALSTREFVDWAVNNGRLGLPRSNPRDVLASKMARALRLEQAIDQYGRHYRVNHAVRIMKNGTQLTLWGKMDFASREHMEKSFTQRREQIIGSCFHLKTDIDVYNGKNLTEEPVQLILDFTEDVAEREIVREIVPEVALV